MTVAPGWEEVPLGKPGLVLPKYRRADGFEVSYAASRGAWSAYNERHIRIDELGDSFAAMALMIAVDRLFPLPAQSVPEAIRALAFDTHGQLHVYTDRGRFFRLFRTISTDGRGASAVWQSVALPAFPP